MTLAQKLREAMDLGRSRSPILLEGDQRDPLADPDQPVTPAAVLVPIVDRPVPTVILTLRPETMRKHPGQVSFPGGRIDPEDDGPVDARCGKRRRRSPSPARQSRSSASPTGIAPSQATRSRRYSASSRPTSH
jgi:hypothetical protein